MPITPLKETWTRPTTATKEERAPKVVKLPTTWHAPSSGIPQVDKLAGTLEDIGDVNLAVRAAHGDLAWALQAVGGMDAATAAEADRIARERGLPFRDVAEQAADFKTNEKVRNILDLLSSTDEHGNLLYQKTADWLADPQKMAALQDDVKAIAQLEAYKIAQDASFAQQASYTLWESTKDVAQNALVTAAKAGGFVTKTGSDLEMAMANVRSVRPTDPLLAQGFNFETGEFEGQPIQTGAYRRDAMRRVEDQIEADIWKPMLDVHALRSTPLPRQEGVRGLALSAIEMVPQVVGALAVGAPTGEYGAAAFMASHIYGGTYRSLIEQGASEQRASQAAMLNALMQAPLESIGIGKLLSVFKATGPLLAMRKLFETMGTEFVTEWAQSYPESITSIWGLAQKNNQEFGAQLDEFFGNLPETTLEGMYEGTVAATVALVGGGAGVTSMAMRSQRDADLFKQIMDIVEGSAAPEQMAAVIDHIAPETSRLYLSAQAVDALFQEGNEEFADADALYEQLGVTDQVQEARLTGRELEIERKEWLKVLAKTQTGQNLVKDIRFKLNDSTERESENVKQDLASAIRDMQETYNELQQQFEYPAVQDLPPQIAAIRDRFMAKKDEGGLGLAAGDADAVLSVFMAGAHQLSRQSGESIQEWFNRVAPTVEVGGVAPEIEKVSVSKQETVIAEPEAEIEQAIPIKEEVPIVTEETAQKETMIKPSRQDKIAEGADVTTVGPDNVEYAFKLQVLDLDDIKLEESEYQPRDRSRMASQAQIDEIARKLNPKRLVGVESLGSGTPIISPDTQAIAGFGRLKALAKAQGTEQFEAYRNHLVELGFAEAANIKKPVLVRVATEGTDLFQLSRISNKPEIAAYSRPEQAKLDANKLSDDDILGIVPGEAGLRDALLAARNRPAIRQLVEKLADGDLTEFIDAQGELSKQGLERIMYALLSKTYEGKLATRMMESTEENVRNVVKAIEDSLPKILKHEGLVRSGVRPEELSIVDDIAKVTNAFSELRARGEKVSHYLAQSELFDRSLNSFQEQMLKDFDERARSAKKLRLLIESYADEIGRAGVNVKQTDIFGAEIQDKGSFWEKAKEAGQQELFQAERGMVQFKDAETVIHLFETADMSTFLHEVNHVFVRDMKRIIDAGLGDEQLRADYEALVAYGDGLDAQGNIANPEKVAKAFEGYLREGKAPSLSLTAAFDKFVGWLTAIYKSIERLGIKMVQPEIKAVFDRMLASGIEIEAARNYYQARRSIVEIMDNVTETEKAKIRDRQTRAKTDAKTQRLKQLLRAYMRAIGGRKALRKEAETEIDAMPAYKARQDIVDAGGLSRQFVVENYGLSTANQLENNVKGQVSPGGKASLGDMAAKHEYESEGALVDALLKAKNRAEAVTDRVNEKEAEAFANIEREMAQYETVVGDEAFHNEAHLDYLIAEAQLLSDKIGAGERRVVRRVNQKALRDGARSSLARMPVSRAIAYHRFARAEMRWAKQAYALIEQGKLEEALEAKNMQLVNHALVLESVKVREETQKIEKAYGIKRFTSRIEKTENSFRNAVIQLANTYGLTPDGAFKPDAEAVDYIEQLRDIDMALHDLIPDWIRAKEKPAEYERPRDLTLEQFRELHEVIESIRNYGKDTLLAMRGKEWATVDALANASIAEAQGLPDYKAPEEGTTKGTIEDQLKRLGASTSLARFLFKKLDGYPDVKVSRFGPLGRVFRHVMEAEANFQNLLHEAMDFSEPYWSVLYEARKRIENLHGGALFEIEGTPVTEKQRRVGRYRWSFEQLCSVVLNMGAEENVKAMMDGYGYTEEQLNAIAAQFERAELDAIQGVFEASSLLFDRYDQAFFNVYNRRLRKVPARELTVTYPDGSAHTIKGGYYHLDYDPKLDSFVEQFKSQEADDVLSLVQRRNSNNFRQYLRKGATHERVERSKLPPKLSLNVWTSAVRDQARLISHLEVMRDLHRLTKHKEWRAMVEQKLGPHAYKEIRNWAAFQALPERHIPDGFWGNIGESLRSKATIAALGWRAISGLVQRTAHLTTISKFGVMEWYRAYREMDFASGILGLQRGEAWQRMREMSTYLPMREKAFDREFYDLTSKMNPLFTRKKIFGREISMQDIKEFTYVWLQMNDRTTVGPAWQAGFNKAWRESLEIEMTDDERRKHAIEQADDAAMTTQGGGLPFEQTGIQRAEGWVRLFTLFMTWQTTFSNIYRTDFNQWKTGKITTGEYMQKFMWVVLAGPLAEVVLRNGLRGELPEWYDLFFAPFKESIGFIPLVRDVPSTIEFRKPTGESPVFEGFRRGTKAAASVWDLIMDDGEWDKALWDIGRTVEWWSGVPALNFVTEVKRLQKNLEEPEE